MKLHYFFIAVLFTAFTFAQDKVGTVNTDLIISKMPEFTKVQEDAKKYSDELDKQLKEKLEDYKTKVEAYQKGGFTDVMKKTKEDELIRLEGEIQQFRQNGTQMVQLKQQDLLRPLYEKMAKVIEEVAVAEGYSQILNLGSVELAYFSPSHDVTAIVLTKLGIKE